MFNIENIKSIPMWGSKAVSVVIGLLAIWVCIRLCMTLLNRLSSKYITISKYSPLIKTIVKIAVLFLGVLIILDSLGVSITPILASLGVGGLAVGLALKDTLDNYFSGFYLLVDRPIRIGDFVRLESGEEGYVDSIGWRSTRIRMLDNKTVIFPNKILSSSRIINYDYPSPEVAVLVEVGVDYASDLRKVEMLTIETADEIQTTIEGAVKKFKPFIRYHTFAESSINFTVILRVENFVASYLIKHEFIKRLHENYCSNNIVIPFPIRTLYMSNTSKERIV